MGIRQLASELRLSIGTVSRALNDRPDVNPETRARVKEAALRAGYVPNQSGRSLRSGRTGIAAAVIPSHGVAPQSDAGLFTVLEGARRTLQRRALDLIVLFRGSDEDPLGNLQRIVQRRIANSIIVSQTTANDPRLAWMQAEGVEFVAFGRSAGLEGYPFVDFDVESAAAETVRTFVRDGHRRLAVTVGQRPANYQTLLLQAMRAEASRLGIGAGAVVALPTDGSRLTEAACADARARGRGADRGAGGARVAGHRALRRVRAPRPASRPRGLGDLHLPGDRRPRAAAGPVATSTPTSTPSAWRWPSICSRCCPTRRPTSSRPPSRLVPLRFVPRDSHQPLAARVRG